MSDFHMSLRDQEPEMVAAWRLEFADLITSGRVDVSCGEIFDASPADCLVSPANSFGHMDGGIDAVYLRRFGFQLQDRVQAAIEKDHAGELPVGVAILVPTEDPVFPNLCVAPTMRVPGDVSGSVNAYLALRAALLTSLRFQIKSLLSPGLATAIGGLDYTLAARQMRRAWNNVVEGQRTPTLEEARRSQAAMRGLAWALS